MNYSRIYDIDYASHIFISGPLLQDFISSMVVNAVVHNPNHIQLSNNYKRVSFDINGTYGEDVAISISKVEVIKRRDKSNDRCGEQWRNWYELALSKHIVDIGCVPTYLETLKTVPICSTMGKLKRWSNIIAAIKNQNDYLPCQHMPMIDFDLKITNMDKTEELMTFAISYPEQVIVITQSRAVNIDALIGNIGGYIGLFLGILYKFILLIVRKLYIK